MAEQWHGAVRMGFSELVQRMIAEGADMSRRDGAGLTALHSVSERGLLDLVKMLLNEGADVWAESSDGRTPLHSAAGGGSARVVRALLDAGADVSSKTTSGRTALHFAVRWRGAMERSRESCESTLAVVRVLIDAGADVVAIDCSGETVLHSTAGDGLNAIVDQLLLGKGAACVNIKNTNGRTALHLAVQGMNHAPNHKVVQTLLDNGADVNLQTSEGDTPLHLAVQHCGSGKKLGVVRNLLSAGADVAAMDRSGQSALARTSAMLGTFPISAYQHESIRRVVALLTVAVAEQARRYEANAMAFAMGLLDRLGAESFVRGLDAEVVRMVVQADEGARSWFTHRDLWRVGGV